MGHIPNPSVFSGNVEQVGIILQNNMGGFIFEENDFFGGGGNVDITVGSICKNLGRFNNEVRRNNYEGVDIGNLALGENSVEEGNISRGLQYFCNDNTNVSLHDFYVSNQLGTATIRKHQGVDDIDFDPPFRASGNTFSFEIGQDFTNNNEDLDVNYFFFDEQIAGNPQEPLGISNITPFDANENSCPEDYCEPPCKTDSQLHASKIKYYDDRTKKDIAKSEQEQAVLQGNTILADTKEKEAARYRKEMDKEAFMVVLHLVTDSISLDEDSLEIWAENLDLFSMDMFFSLQQQGKGNFAVAQRMLDNASKRNNLSQRERETLSEMPDLMKIIARKDPAEFNHTQLKELERLAENRESFVGNISRNLLTLHGYNFTPVFNLPQTRQIIELKNESASFFSNISVFPNPAKDFITIQNLSDNKQSPDKKRFRIINSEGKIVKEFLLSSGENRTLETTDFSTGLYFYQLFSNEQAFETGKFLIQ